MFLVRSVKTRRLAQLEECVHNGLRDKGFMAPAVWAAEDDSPELGSVVVMDYVDAIPLMSAGACGGTFHMLCLCLVVCTVCGSTLTVCHLLVLPTGAIAKNAPVVPLLGSLQFTLFTLPEVCGRTAASLHLISAESVLERLRRAGFEREDVGLKAWLASYRPRVAAIASSGVCPSFVKVLDWLDARYRPDMDDEATSVVCHGDLFPPNILLRRHASGTGNVAGRVTALIDWSCVVITTPAFDVGVCRGGFEGAHVACPSLLRWLTRMVKNGVSSRFYWWYSESTRHVADLNARSQRRSDVNYFRVCRFLFAMTPFLEARIPGRKPHRYLLQLAPLAENEYMDSMVYRIKQATGGLTVSVPHLPAPPRSGNAVVAVLGVVAVALSVWLLWVAWRYVAWLG